MDELVRIEVVQTEGAAVALCSLLESAGIKCMHRLTNTGAGAFDGWAAAASQEIIVRAEDADLAREILQSSDTQEP
jgi:hypothetical protein